MPRPGKAWYHITLGTYASWLPGDPRGFRDHGHRIHSSGDHRHRPPSGEHQGLRAYSREQAGETTVIPSALRAVVGEKLVGHLDKLGHEVIAVAVGGMHVHLLVELQAKRDLARHEITRCKQSATLAVRGRLEGKLWARNMGIKPVRDREHQLNVYRYILAHRGEGVWVWDCRGGESDTCKG